ncbi:hypothetical protein [Stakelama pacifica]|uniref:hypothetical protein n=1 Tax=Stakelama pacifica TaxID=517720 RepID=UPI0019BBF49F|nr:hypothetical protein [Stakelama pacifica]GGO91367.1 hypothetical protein GCM10011329_05940 [Stakelama pacifica]
MIFTGFIPVVALNPLAAAGYRHCARSELQDRPRIDRPSADEIIVDEVKPFRFAERDGTVSDLLSAMTPAD